MTKFNNSFPNRTNPELNSDPARIAFHSLSSFRVLGFADVSVQVGRFVSFVR